MKTEETAEEIRLASNAVWDANFHWRTGADASVVLRMIERAEAHLAAAKERLRVHIGD